MKSMYKPKAVNISKWKEYLSKIDKNNPSNKLLFIEKEKDDNS